jgi:hypothetical protein
MMPHLMELLAKEHERDRQRSIDAHFIPFNDSPRHRPHRVGVRCGYWLISVGCRLVAPDLSAAAH